MKKVIEYIKNKLQKVVPKFFNRPNQLIKAIDGKEYWISRSPALVAVILGIYKDNVFVLAEQRSEKMDQPGKWCVPCGYLDWDESGYEGVIREVYEELGLYLNDPNIRKQLIMNNSEQPFYVNTKPSENRQNVALTYCGIYDFEKIGLPELNPDVNEVKKAEWIPIEYVFNKELYDWAFSHDERIEMAVMQFQAYIQWNNNINLDI